jgi:hypothetical protein
MAATKNKKMKSAIFIAAAALFLLTGFNAQAQQEAKPSYPGLSIQPSNNTTSGVANRSRSRNVQPAENAQGYSGVMAAPRAHTNRRSLRRFNQQQKSESQSPYLYSRGAVGTSGQATERQNITNTPPEQEEAAVIPPKPIEARFAASEHKINLIKALRERRKEETEQRRQDVEARAKEAERRQMYRKSGSIALP